jgi:hypothetical protein
VHGIRREPVEAIIDYSEAIDHIQRDVTRHRLMNSIATAFREVGNAAFAIGIADHVAAHAIEVEARANALTLRYNLAVDVLDDAMSESCRRTLEGIEKPPTQLAEYFEALARDHAAHRRLRDARTAAKRMRETAEKYQMNELLFRAEDALKDIRRGLVPAIYAYRPTKLTTTAEQKLAVVERALAALIA